MSLMRSRDGGRTWGEDKVILTFEGENGVNMMCPALLMMQNGDVGLFYLVRLTYARTQIFLRRSSDGGRTWGERVVCTPQEDFFVMNNDRVVRLESGRIIVPVASHRSGRDTWTAAPWRCSSTRMTTGLRGIGLWTSARCRIRPIATADCRSRVCWSWLRALSGAGPGRIWGGSLKCSPWTGESAGRHASHRGSLRPTAP